MSLRGAVRAVALLAALAGVAGFTALGLWQLDRRVWKRDLIARVDAGLAAPAVPAPTGVDGAAEYARVYLTGRFRHMAEAQVQAVTDLGPGYWVLTPLDTEQGAVFVNRGFVPQDRRDPATRLGGQVTGDVQVTGLLRQSEPGGGFLRANDPAAGRWYSRDVAAMAAARGVAPVAPYFVDADATPNPGGLPVGGLTVVTFRNQHLSYALTWFALAAGLAGATAWVVVAPRLHRGGDRTPSSR